MRHLCMILLALAFVTTNVAAMAPESRAQGGRVDVAGAIEIAQKRRQAAGEVYLLRGGGLGMFSRGLDALAADLKAKGIPAKVVSHSQWRNLVRSISKNSSKRGRRPVVLIGHSLGANRALDIAAELKAKGIRVDYLVTLAATAPKPVSGNVRRATNFYFKKAGWGKPLSKGRGFRGRLRNVDISGKRTVNHMNIDEQRDLHRQIVSRVLSIFGRSRRAELSGIISPAAG